MKTTKQTLLSIAIMLTLPLTAMAENISGPMYVAPTYATPDNPAPLTNVLGAYGRINIDTADQQNIASTAYVKGAYNSAIAAVNKVNGEMLIDKEFRRVTVYSTWESDDTVKVRLSEEELISE